ncbi:MAG: hypothetical protein JSV03_05510, partial [Planctomycetota bacterium]
MAVNYYHGSRIRFGLVWLLILAGGQIGHAGQAATGSRNDVSATGKQNKPLVLAHYYTWYTTKFGK